MTDTKKPRQHSHLRISDDPHGVITVRVRFADGDVLRAMFHRAEIEQAIDPRALVYATLHRMVAEQTPAEAVRDERTHLLEASPIFERVRGFTRL